ncbi:MAG: hypothetical protein KBC81_02330 [Candidatus Pacebacteria bacterium]|nr:hypothetical protein [Candidatus Paceibacterota bacterium]
MKKYYTKLSALVSSLYFYAVPVLASTQTDSALANAPGVNLTIQGLMGIVQGLACYSTQLVTIVMVVVIVWYGFQMMASQGNQTKFTNARKSLGYAVVGMIVILGAYTIIATVANTVVGIGAQDLSTRSATYTRYIPLNCSI